MPSTPDRYQWYAEILHEPITMELRAFVDALEGVGSEPLPSSLLNFTPSVVDETPWKKARADMYQNANQEDIVMHSSSSAPLQLQTGHSTNTLPHRSRQAKWSLALIAAVLIILIGGVFLRNTLLQAGSSSSNTNVISCIEVTTQQPTGSATSCISTRDPHIASGNMVFINFCLAPHSIYSGKGSMIHVVTKDNDPTGSFGQEWGWGREIQQCSGSGRSDYQPGHYHIKLYWSPLITEPTAQPVTSHDFASGQWHLQNVDATFDIT